MSSILFITRKWAPAMGGMETYCHRLTEELAKTCAVEIVALPGNADGSPPAIPSLLGFPFTILRRWLARASAPDILHIADMALWPVGLLAGKRTQVLLSAHGTDVSFHRRGGIKGGMYGTYLRLGSALLPRAKVIANSHATAEVAKETGWTNSAVVPLGTDPQPNPPTHTHGSHILFAGRLVHRKGCGWFVREVLAHVPGDMRLRIAGTGWDASEAHVIEDPRVDYLGRLDAEELAKAYSEALCVIVPNIEPENGEYEGFGLVAPEAASAGGIVLASDHGGLRDAVIDGETGYLLPSGDAKSWIHAISKITAWSPDERAQFCTKAQSTARDQYSWHRFAQSVLSLGGVGK